MRNTLIFAALFLLSSVASAGGTYDGIWVQDAALTTDYYSVHQNGTSLVVADLDPAKSWDAYQGTIVDNKATVSLIISVAYPGAKAAFTLEFSSLTKATLTLSSCTPTPNSYCTVAIGAQIPLKKIF